MQRHDVASTLSRRCINVMCPLGCLVWQKFHCPLPEIGYRRVETLIGCANMHTDLGICCSQLTYLPIEKLYEPQPQKTYVQTRVSSGHSDQPAHLIRILTRHIFNSQGWKVYSCEQRRLIKLHGCACWLESWEQAGRKLYIMLPLLLTSVRISLCICTGFLAVCSDPMQLIDKCGIL